ncbi:hypothetical protein PT287_09755 [Lactobacillus sp. ESL0679]|uniref:hypothetical protein n=1 Tax=Lactobacillus sp. ESL0679 TaxID=2983209 RepID=UPI0023F7DE84|nr:hypothetical protein [Lactobacillus sp. ESL0679]MDF7683782.1 hypothetical protein [Lactobacillus sp. ESL0679]
MAEDFLSSFADKSKKILGNELTKSPYKVGKEPTRTAQIRLETYKKVKKIAFESDRKVVDVLDDLLQIGLNNSNLKDYLK